MGNVASVSQDQAAVYLRDQTRFSIASVAAANSRGQTLLRVSPNAFPATRFLAQREPGDDAPLEYIQDPESFSSAGAPSFLLRLSSSDEIIITFTFNVRQQGYIGHSAGEPSDRSASSALDTHIAGLTFIFASNAKEVDNLVVREFQLDPNLHKNPNVELLGDYSTSGSPLVQFTYTWKWRPPRSIEDRGGGWRNHCSFVEYNQRSHRLDTLATFSFWVPGSQRSLGGVPRSPQLELGVATRLRVPSTQSVESRGSNISDSEGEGSHKDTKEQVSPPFDPIPEDGLGAIPPLGAASGANSVKIDVATCKPGEDPSLNDDGPLFRATMRSLEQKTGNMRQRMKKVLRTAEAAEAAQHACNQAVADFTEALREASASNANAVKPALDHYFEKIAKEILLYEKQNSVNLHKLIIEPISRLYNIEIKQADFKKREFDEESKEYYAYVSKYLGQRSESQKEKKQKSDEKYQAKRRTFELKRFDYSNFIHDLHGGRKDQEVLSHLTKYADAQARGYLATAKKVDEMLPQLDALIAEVKAADQDFLLSRTEREEKRRALESGAKAPPDDTSGTSPSAAQTAALNGVRGETELARSGTLVSGVAMSQSPPSSHGTSTSNGFVSHSTSSNAPLHVSPSNKFKGIRDLEDSGGASANGGAQRKEGLLWALSRPGSHADPKGINKAAWHKFWVVLDQGRLSEYVNWKDRLDLHIDPIDLRVASVREARSSERRFCFEVITPHFTRVYQAPSEDEMKSWIGSINNALQSAFESKDNFPTSPSPAPSSTRKDIAAVLTGKSLSFSGHRQVSNPNRHEAAKAVGRHATTGGDKAGYHASDQTSVETSPLLQRIRAADEANKFCADCRSDSKVDWCSINLGALLCIECSGIHRSLGTHISKVRSLTLDTAVFTPDLVEALTQVGNRTSNAIWEAKLDRFLKPSPHSTREQRLHFITAKYGERMYVQGLPTSTQTPEDHLLTSIKRNSISDVLHALALRANPNAHDRSRSTHALYLALAAVDPASPAGATFSHQHSASASTLKALTTPPLSSSALHSSRPSSRGASPVRKLFPVAELLLQNGADIPTEQSPFPLSPAAKQYIDLKNDQRAGRAVSATASASRDVHGEAPPSIQGTTSAFGTSAPQGSTAGTMLERASRERERLVKRNNAHRISRPSLAVEALETFAKK